MFLDQTNKKNDIKIVIFFWCQKWLSPQKNHFDSYNMFLVSLVLKHILNTFFLHFSKERNFCMGQIWTFPVRCDHHGFHSQHRTWTWLAPAFWQATLRLLWPSQLPSQHRTWTYPAPALWRLASAVTIATSLSTPYLDLPSP